MVSTPYILLIWYIHINIKLTSSNVINCEFLSLIKLSKTFFHPSTSADYAITTFTEVCTTTKTLVIVHSHPFIRTGKHVYSIFHHVFIFSTSNLRRFSCALKASSEVCDRLGVLKKMQLLPTPSPPLKTYTSAALFTCRIGKYRLPLEYRTSM